MALGHERLDVYRLAIGYVAWVYEIAARLEGVHRAARDQWLRASQSIPLDIAEGNGKTAVVDRRRYFEIARGSALECALTYCVSYTVGLCPFQRITAVALLAA
ncbi:MAG: four helix bundle protein [Lentisphaerae bacterium]|nr:four helix bundle protein [Lentisphaerota bacterium]